MKEFITAGKAREIAKSEETFDNIIREISDMIELHAGHGGQTLAWMWAGLDDTMKTKVSDYLKEKGYTVVNSIVSGHWNITW